MRPRPELGSGQHLDDLGLHSIGVLKLVDHHDLGLDSSAAAGIGPGNQDLGPFAQQRVGLELQVVKVEAATHVLDLVVSLTHLQASRTR